MIFLGIPIYVVALVFFGTAFLTGMAIKYSYVNRSEWRNVSTFAAIVSSVGLIALAIETRSSFAIESQSRLLNTYVVSGAYIRSSASFEKNYFCDTFFVKSDSSPSEFDENIEDQKKLCSWFTSVFEITENIKYGDAPFLAKMIPALPQLNSDLWGATVNRFLSSVEFHDRESGKLRMLSELVNPEYQRIIDMLLPLTLAFSLGLQVGITRAS